jgi:hypothetical protein
MVERGPVPYLSLAMVPKFNQVGTWQLTFDAHSPAYGLLEEGGGIVVYRDGETEPFFSGVWMGRTRDAGEGSPTETITLQGYDDNWWMSTRLVLPDPAKGVNNQDVLAYYTQNDPVETIACDLVDLNAGPGARAAREITGLSISPSLGRGGNFKAATRFDQLDLYLFSLLRGRGLGWRCKQVSGSLEFGVYETEDKSDSIILSRRRGNLLGYKIEESGPRATAIAVAGGGRNIGRNILEAINTTAETDWQMRIEQFVDKRDTKDTDELTDAAYEAVNAGLPDISCSVSPVDIPGVQYGVDYELGDTISIEAGPISISKIVRSVTLTSDGSGVSKAVPVVGDDNTINPPGFPKAWTQIRQLAARLGQLERRY